MSIYPSIHLSIHPFLPADEEVRECVLLFLDEKFDTHLAQAENLTSLFVAIYDRVHHVTII